MLSNVLLSPHTANQRENVNAHAVCNAEVECLSFLTVHDNRCNGLLGSFKLPLQFSFLFLMWSRLSHLW